MAESTTILDPAKQAAAEPDHHHQHKPSENTSSTTEAEPAEPEDDRECAVISERVAPAPLQNPLADKEKGLARSIEGGACDGREKLSFSHSPE